MPCHIDPPRAQLVRDVSARVGRVLVVDDGMSRPAGEALADLAREAGFEVLRFERNAGKGSALAAGLEHLRSGGDAPEAVLVVDADGQHPPSAIPALLEAATEAELVVGDRFGDLRAMPPHRRAANRLARLLLVATTGRRVYDTQCGMRVLRGRALTVPFSPGRYEAETRHLKRCLRARVRVAWVPIPAIYAGESSSFRPLADTLRVLRALLR